MNPRDGNIIYFGPGVHEINSPYGILKLKSNQTVYIAGGGVLRARIHAENAENIKIMGRGILEGTFLKGRWPEPLREIMGEDPRTERPYFVDIRQSENIVIEGIIIKDTPHWTVRLLDSKNININNLKLVGYVPNSDGIDCVNSRDIIIDDVFIRTSDDCLAVKGLKDSKTMASAKNIIVKNSTFWADAASALEIGHETVMEEIRNVRFENIDILMQRYQTLGYHAMDIPAVDNAVIQNIYYDNIRVERCSRLAGIRINKSMWCTSERRGIVKDIYFKNICCMSNPDIHLFGYTDKHIVENVTFENLFVNGKMPGDFPALKTNFYVKDIKLVQNGNTVSHIHRPYPQDLSFRPVNISPYTNFSLAGMINEMSGETQKGAEAQRSGEEQASPADSYAPCEFAAGPVPFLLAGDAGIKTAAAISGKGGAYPAKSRNIPILNYVRYIFFLHTLNSAESDIHTLAFKYEIAYENGCSAEIPVYSKTDISGFDLWSLAGWQYTIDGIRVYIMQWKNPNPDWKIKHVRMASEANDEIPVMLGLTLGQ